MYLNVDKEIATACLISIKRHLWYLMPEHVFLSLFNPMVSIDDKQLLAVTLLSHSCHVHDVFQPGKPDFQTPLLALNSEEIPSLSAFITKDTWFLSFFASKYLERNNIVCTFAQLKEHPAVWEDYEEYSLLGKWVTDFSVTNDASERGVKNAQEVAFVGKKECVRENAMLVMNMQRAKCPKLNKSNLANII